MSSFKNNHTKTLILSSSGLKNVIFTNNEMNLLLLDENEFKFKFGQKEIKMNRFFADFISPRASYLHFSDITIDNIDLTNMIKILSLIDDNMQQTELITDKITTLLLQLSCGNEIEIDESTNQIFRLISILIGNEEMYQKTDKLFQGSDQNSNKKDINEMVQYLLELHDLNSIFYDDTVLSYLSSHFYSIDTDTLLKLPKSVLYSIISNENIQLENEDSLVDFIYEIFNSNNSNDDDHEINSIAFLEQVDFTSLSKDKFYEIFQLFEPQEITKTLWEKILKCIDFNTLNDSPKRSNKSRYIDFDYLKPHKGKKIIQIPYDFNSSNCFKGIIYYLTNEFEINPDEVIKITASSYRSSRTLPKNASMLLVSSSFCSQNQRNSWLCYDFQDRMVRPSYYSIRTWGKDAGMHHLKNWEIQASNDCVEWSVLDSRKDESSLNDQNAFQTFKIQNLRCSDQFFRYIRIIQTGVNSGGTFHLNIQSLEFFGDICER